MTGLLVFIGIWCGLLFAFGLGWVCAGLCASASVSDEWVRAIEEAEAS